MGSGVSLVNLTPRSSLVDLFQGFHNQFVVRFIMYFWNLLSVGHGPVRLYNDTGPRQKSS